MQTIWRGALILIVLTLMVWWLAFLFGFEAVLPTLLVAGVVIFLFTDMRTEWGDA